MRFTHHYYWLSSHFNPELASRDKRELFSLNPLSRVQILLRLPVGICRCDVYHRICHCCRAWWCWSSPSTSSCLRATLHRPQAPMSRHQEEEVQRQPILICEGARGCGETARGGWLTVSGYVSSTGSAISSGQPGRVGVGTRGLWRGRTARQECRRLGNCPWRQLAEKYRGSSRPLPIHKYRG